MSDTTMIDRLGRDLRKEFPEMWLGTLVWYYVPSDAEVRTKDWLSAITGTTVESMAPTPPRAVDAFKRAVAKIGKTGTTSLGEGDEKVLFKFMTRDSGQDADAVYRDLVVERLGEHQLSYGPVVKFIFRRDSKDITHIVDEEVLGVIPPEIQTEIHIRIDAAYKQYNRERFVLGPIKIRDLIRHEIETRQLGLACKPGAGIYFVFDSHLDRVQGIAEALEHLASHGITFHQMPVADVASQREMIIKAFENDTVAEVDRLMADMSETLKGNRGRITQAVATRYARDFSRLNSRLSEYSDLLEQKFEEQGSRLAIMQSQVLKLVEAIPEDA